MKPSIIDPLRVGSQVTLTQGEWNVPVSANLELLADGVKVGSGKYHTLTADLLGKKLSVRVNASRSGFDPVTVTSDELGPVTEGVFNPTTPEIEDVPIVGVPLGVTLLNSTTRATYSYQWLAGGVEIEGADESEFTPTEAELGKTLTVRLTMSAPGYTNLERVSAPSVAVVGPGTLPFVPGTPPMITGLPTVGEGLEANHGGWEPTPATYDYQWLADGQPIPNATNFVLVPTADLVGKPVSVRLTVSRPGYISTSVTTPETAPISNGTPFGAPHDFTETGRTVTSIDLAWREVDDAVKYRIAYIPDSGTSSSKKLDVGRVTTRTLTGLKPNTAYSIEIAAIRGDGRVSEYTPRILAGTSELVAPADLRVTNRTTTSVTIAWTKCLACRYRIYRGIGSGTRTKIEVGDVDTATITGLKRGTTYTIDVASLLSDGTRSSYTPRIPATTAP